MVEVRASPAQVGPGILDRVKALLSHDFPGLDLPLTLVDEDRVAGRARAVVVPREHLSPQAPAGCGQMAFPADSPAAGLGLVFAEDDALLLELRRFYLPPVVFAGAGPGGVGTMTVAATRALAEADVVLTDGLCGTEVLRFAPPSAEIVPVGKEGGKASPSQASINERLLQEAIAGRRVVRLKGGDPAVFGRLEEEIRPLARLRLAYRVIPGVGAASGAAAFVGKPLTVREDASELYISTGRVAGGARNPFPLEGRRAPAVAMYMSRKVLAERMQDLVEAGFASDTAVTVVEKLGSPAERAVCGTIASIADVADRADVGTPAVVIVGSQHGEADHLPLHGVRVWLPAERETGEGQRERLEALGASCVQEPLIEPVARPVDDDRVLEPGRFDWVLFTSKRSVDFFFALLASRGLDARWLPRVAAIGAPTVAKLKRRGIEPDLVPSRPTRDALSAALIEHGLAGARVLHPASAIAPDHVRETLAPHAAEVVRVDLYTLRYPEVTAVPDADVVLFSSASTVDSAREQGLLDEIRDRGLIVGGIGPATGRAIEEARLTLSIVPDGTDPEALARATRRYFARLEIARLRAGEDRA